MDFFDAVLDIHKNYPEIREDEIRSAMDSEVAAEEARLSGRNKYRRAVASAHYRILDWLANGDEYSVILSDLDDLAKFIASHRHACVWAVIKAKQRKGEEIRRKRDELLLKMNELKLK